MKSRRRIPFLPPVKTDPRSDKMVRTFQRMTPEEKRAISISNATAQFNAVNLPRLVEAKAKENQIAKALEAFIKQWLKLRA